MNVAFYAPMKPPDHPVPSGDRQMARHLLAALRRCGHTVDVVSRFRSYDGDGDPQRQRRLSAVGQGLAERLARRLAATERGARPEMWFTYHLYHKAPDWLGPIVADRLSIPYVVAEASYAPKRRRGRWAESCRMTAAAISRADLVIGLNPGDAACVRPLLDGPHRWLSLPPFIDTRPFAAARRDRQASRAAVCRNHRLNADHPILMTVAMMRPGDKHASYALLAASLAMLRDQPWTLLIAGDGPARDQVLSAFAPLGRRVLYLGAPSAEALPALYAAADLFVWPAINEAFGVVFMEAHAAGLPAVAGRSDGVGGIVADGVTGMLVDVGNAAAFAGAVRCLLADAGRRRSLAEAAHEHAQRRHSLGAAATILAPALAALTNSGRSLG